jgi:hypothetical protein
MGVSPSFRVPGPDDADDAVGFAGNEFAPSRITGALKLMFGRLGGGWKEAGRPPGRLACMAELDCWTPGGGAIPGADDMPGGGPKARQWQCPGVREPMASTIAVPFEDFSPRPGGGAMPGAPLDPGNGGKVGGGP